MSQRDHYIQGHRVNVELALPMCNDSLYETDIVVPNETWLEKVQRKLSYAVPDQVGRLQYKQNVQYNIRIVDQAFFTDSFNHHKLIWVILEFRKNP